MSLGELMKNSRRLYEESEEDFAEFMDNLSLGNEGLHGTTYWEGYASPGYIRVSIPLITARILGTAFLLEEITNFFIPDYPGDFVSSMEADTPTNHEFVILIILKELPMGWDAYYVLKENQGLFNE